MQTPPRRKAPEAVFLRIRGDKVKDWLRIDVSKAQQYAEELKQVLSPQNMHKCMAIAVKDTGTRLRTQVARAVRVDYNVSHGAVLASISPPRMTGGGGSISCLLNIQNSRINIPNSGGGNKRRKRAIYAKAGLKARIAKVEEPLPTSGPKAHYVKRSNGQVITFTGGTFTMKERFHTKNATAKMYTVKKKAYRQGVAIAIPQMPMNRSADAIQEWTQNELIERLNHTAIAMGKGYIKGA